MGGITAAVVRALYTEWMGGITAAVVRALYTEWMGGITAAVVRALYTGWVDGNRSLVSSGFLFHILTSDRSMQVPCRYPDQ